MTEMETTESRNSVTRGGKRGGRTAAAALVLSILALAVSGTALYLQLRGAETAEEEKEEPATEQATLRFRNHILPILKDVEVNPYDASLFQKDADGVIHYQDAPRGIDVSSYQGEIDWKQVADSGVSFAMIRAGLRGYTKGGMMADAMFENNIRGALDAGLDVGVYFFSQAITTAEAEEEADYLLAQIKGYTLSYPIVFDWESVENASARTNNISSDEVTRCANAFCEKIAAAGYQPMVYFNMDQGYLGYRLDRLNEYPFWLAEYHNSPSFYYRFDFWQYTHKGTVPGIEGYVDLDLDLRSYANGEAVQP